jgi:hypothetical protein
MNSEEHKDRTKKCTFLTHLEGKANAKPPTLSTAEPEPPARPRSRKSTRASRVPSPAESAIEDHGRVALARSARGRPKAAPSEVGDDVEKPPAKTLARAKKSTARKSAKAPTPSASEAELEEEGPATFRRSKRERSLAAPPDDKPTLTVPAKTPAKRAAAVKAKTNSRTASIALLSETDRTEDDTEHATLGRSTRKRVKTPVKEEEEAITVIAPKATKRASRKAVTAPPAEEHDVEMALEETYAPPVKPARRTTRAASITHSIADKSAPAPARKPRATKRSIAPSQAEIRDDVTTLKKATHKGRSRATSTSMLSEDEDVNDDAPIATAKPKARPRSKSVSRKAAAAPMSEVEESRPLARSAGNGKPGRGRYHVAESDAAEEELITVAPAKSGTRRRAKSRELSAVPSDVSDTAPNPRARRTRASSRARSIGPSDYAEEVEPVRIRPSARERPLTPSESDHETTKRIRRPRAKSRGDDPATEPEPEHIPVRQATRTRARSRGPSVAPSDTEAVEMPPPAAPKPLRSRPPSSSQGQSSVPVLVKGSKASLPPPDAIRTQSANPASRTALDSAPEDTSNVSVNDELNLLRSACEAPAVDKPERKGKATRSKPPSMVADAPLIPAVPKGKGKHKAIEEPVASGKPTSRASNVLKDAFASVKAHEDSDLDDDDDDLRSPQPMTPALNKVRLKTPDLLTEDEDRDLASSPSPIKPKQAHPRGQYFPSDPHNLTHRDDDEEGDEWEGDESTVILSRRRAKGTPFRPSVQSDARAGPSRASFSTLANDPEDANLSEEDAVEFNVIDVGSDEDTHFWKVQLKKDAAAQEAEPTEEAPVPQPKPVSKAGPVPSSSKTVAPEARPPKLPTKQEAARAQEANKAGVQALRARFASPPPPAAHDDPQAHPAPAAAVPAKPLGEGPVPRPPSSAALLVTLEPHAFQQTLTEEERAMTVEEWIRKQSADEHTRFRREAEEYIRAFERKAAETRAAMEAHLGIA